MAWTLPTARQLHGLDAKPPPDRKLHSLADDPADALARLTYTRSGRKTPASDMYLAGVTGLSIR